MTSLEHSIIIPTNGTAPYLRATLWALIPTLLDSNHVEVLVVENGRQSSKTQALTEHTASLLGNARRHKMRYIHEPTAGTLAGRHRGYSEANGTVLSYIDDDVVVTSGWHDAVSRAFSGRGVSVVGGPCRPLYLSVAPRWFLRLRTQTQGGWMLPELSLIDLPGDIDGISPAFIWSLNLSISRECFVMAGGYHPGLVPQDQWYLQGDEETGLTNNVAQLGARAAFLASAAVYHIIPPHRLTVDYLRRRYRYQGMCDAFSWIRNAYPNPQSSLKLLASMPPNEAAMLVARKVATGLSFRVPSPKGRDYRQGWTDLVRAAEAKPELVDWIRRPSYLHDWHPPLELTATPNELTRMSQSRIAHGNVTSIDS